MTRFFTTAPSGTVKIFSTETVIKINLSHYIHQQPYSVITTKSIT